MTAFAATWAALWAGAAFLSGTALGYRLRRPAVVETCGDVTTVHGLGRDLVAECQRSAGHDGRHVGMDGEATVEWPVTA